MSRRLALRILGGAGFAGCYTPPTVRAAGSLEGFSALLASSGNVQQKIRYRADATILLMGLPIYTRVGAGGGTATLQEARAGGHELLALRFSAGSYPEQARGLNRLGLFEETIVRNNKGPEQAAYFGFVTSSPEDSIEAGEKSMESRDANALYEAIEGSILDGWEASRRADFELPADCDWNGIDRLEALVRNGLEQGSKLKDESQRRPGTPHTFLHTVLDSAWNGLARAKVEYCYNGKRYLLEAERQSDADMGRKLREQGVSVAAERVVRLQGKIINLDEGGKTSFRLWLEERPGRSLPLRFDYKPRGFLRVTFIADNTGGRAASSDS